MSANDGIQALKERTLKVTAHPFKDVGALRAWLREHAAEGYLCTQNHVVRYSASDLDDGLPLSADLTLRGGGWANLRFDADRGWTLWEVLEDPSGTPHREERVQRRVSVDDEQEHSAAWIVWWRAVPIDDVYEWQPVLATFAGTKEGT